MRIEGASFSSGPWFPRLRWWAFAAQCALITIAIAVIGLPLPPIPLAAALTVLAASNVLLGRHFSNGVPRAEVIGGVLLLDTCLLTVMLSVSGGPMNPFTIIYLVHVVLAAVMLGVVWTWVIACVSSACFAVLFLLFDPHSSPMSHAGGFSSHLYGMLGAFLIASGLTALFLTKIIAESRERERRLGGLIANHERLATLTTLAASAAHELGTPLNTIALVIEELGDDLRTRGGFPAWEAELAVVEGQLDRCKHAVSELVASAGGSMAEGSAAVPGTELLDLALRGLAGGIGRVTASPRFLRSTIVVPRRAFAHALRMLIKNGLEAGDSVVAVDVTDGAADTVLITVTDRGSGIRAELLGQLGEPFVTTKVDGRGLGLGVFIARLVADRLRGTLVFDSVPGEGTTASFVLPKECLPGVPAHA